MVKKTVKQKTKELFTEFLDKRELGIYNCGFMRTTYDFRKPKQGENRSLYYLDDALEDNLDKFASGRTTDLFFNFITETLQKGEHEVALYQAIKKTPGAKSYDYDTQTDNIIKTLKPYKKTLFEYVARPKFLEHSWKTLDDVFQTLDSQEQRIAVIEAMMQTKTFASLDTQKNIYNIVQKNIRNPSQFDAHFNRISKVENTRTVVDFIDTPALVVIGFTAEKLIGANLNTDMTSEAIVNGIKRIANTLKDRHKNDLNISNVLMDYNTEKKQYSLHVICPKAYEELNKIVFEKMINDVSRLNSWKDLIEYEKEDSMQIQKMITMSKAFQLHSELSSDLETPKEEVKRVKNKI